MRRILGFLSLALMLSCTPAPVAAQNTMLPTISDQIRIVRNDANGSNQGTVAFPRAFDAIGIGYANGAAVTQATSRTTAVTINTHAGAITMFNAAGAATAASFTVTNSRVRSTDTIILSTRSSTNLYVLSVTAVANGSFQVTYYTTGGVAADAPIINFAVVRSAAT